MTTYMIRTNKHEADQIIRGNKMYVLRKDDVDYAVGDVFDFLVLHNRIPVEHPVSDYKYMISTIERGDPIRDGIVLIGFKRI